MGKYRKQLQALQSNDNLALYHRNMPNLMKELKSKGSKNRIIGPIGTSIQVKEEFKQWMLPIEHAIGKHLSTFITFDTEDRKLMHSLLEKHKIPNVTVSLRSIETTEKHFNCKYPLDSPLSSRDVIRLVNTLEEEEACVWNYLLDWGNIESNGVVDSAREAQAYDQNHRNGWEYGMSQLFFRNRADILKKNANGNTLTQTNFSFPPRKLVQDASRENEINGIQTNLQQLGQEVTQKEAEHSALRRDIRNSDLTGDINNANFEISKISRELGKLNNKKREKEAILRAEQEAQDDYDPSEFHEAIAANKELIVKHQEQIKKTYEPRLISIGEEIEECHNAATDLRGQLPKLKEEINLINQEKDHYQQLQLQKE